MRFFDLPPELADPNAAAAAILPVAYDATCSWMRGSAKGPAAILDASQYVELYDIETRTDPSRKGIAHLPAIEFDGPPEELSDMVQARTAEIIEREQLPIILGGEHSVTIGAVRAAADRYEGLSVLQIDAHADTREEYHGSSHNHACVMARVRERCPIVQVGIRAIDTEEAPGLDPHRTFWAHEIVGERDRSWMDRVVELLTDDVYVTIDVDGFDPSVFPATGTPEPGGLDWYEVNELLRRVAERKRVRGFDVVELLPSDAHPASSFTAAKLVYRFLAEIWKGD